jgi:HlyD family secretion protein
MSKRKIVIVASITIISAVVIFILSTNGNGEEGIAVQTAKVESQRIVETVTATGVIQPQTQVKISADVAAKIMFLGVNDGDWVEEGHLLVRLDQEKFIAAVERSQANLRAMEATANLVKQNMVKSEKDFNRTEELFSKNLESPAVRDQVYAAYQVEKARYQSTLEQVDQARATLKEAKDNLSKTTIYSPMAGTISALNKEVGEIALGSQFQEDVIMVVSNLSGMEALVDVDENDIVSIQLGDSATIEVDALPDKRFMGIVSEIANSAKITAEGSADQKTEFEVKIAINLPGVNLRPGMTASADIVTEVRDDAVVVPIQSVAVRTPDQLQGSASAEAPVDSADLVKYTPDRDGFVQAVFVVHDDEVIANQVKTGIQSETHIEILDGIAKGDLIVTGNYRAISQTLTNNSKVKVQDQGQKSLAAK